MDEEATSRAEQINEAYLRMQAMDLPPNVIDGFFENRRYYTSDLGATYQPVGAIYLLSETIEDLEEGRSVLVYFAAEVDLGFASCRAILYVGPNKEKWEEERRRMVEIYPFAFTYSAGKQDISDLLMK